MAKRSYVQTERFALRCSPEELAMWRAAAKVRDVSLSRYIRGCLAEADTKVRVFSKSTTEPHTDPALLQQIAAIGNNLNQIVRWANAHKSSAEAIPVEEEVRHTRKALEAIAHMGKQSC